MKTLGLGPIKDLNLFMHVRTYVCVSVKYESIPVQLSLFSHEVPDDVAFYYIEWEGAN